MKEIISYGIYDARYYTDPDRAIFLLECDSLKEAEKEKHEFGEGNAIVKMTCREISKNKFEIIKEELIK